MMNGQCIFCIHSGSPTFRFQSVSLVPSQNFCCNEPYFVFGYPTQSIPDCYLRIGCMLISLSGRGLDRLDGDPEALGVAVDLIHLGAAPEAAKIIEEANVVLVLP